MLPGPVAEKQPEYLYPRVPWALISNERKGHFQPKHCSGDFTATALGACLAQEKR